MSVCSIIAKARKLRIKSLVYLRDTFSLLRMYRGSIALLFFTAMVFIYLEQMHEIFRSIVEDNLLADAGWKPKIELFSAGASFLAMVSAFFYVSVSIFETASSKYLPSRVKRVAPYIPAVFVLVLSTSVAIGLWKSQATMLTGSARDAASSALKFRYSLPDAGVAGYLLRDVFKFNLYLAIGSLIIAGTGIAVAILTIAKSDDVPRDRPKPFSSKTTIWYFFFAVAVLAIPAILVASPVFVPKLLGPIAVFCLFIVTALFLLTAISLSADRYRIPFTAIIVAAAVLLSILDWNDNHGIYRKNLPLATEPALQPTLTAAFELWLAERKSDRERFRREGKKYPIYIVAAQGGGMYAAAHTASTLSTLQHLCPSFRNHLFAVSAVSGGAVGAAAFATALHHSPEKDTAKSNVRCNATIGPYTNSLMDLTEQLLNEDLLGSLTSGLLFSDLLQRFLPVPIASFDRAYRLELALERAWDAVVADMIRSPTPLQLSEGNFLSSRFDQHWSASSRVPALIMNTTEVGSGRRQLVSPFTFSGRDIKFIPLSGRNTKGETNPGFLKLSTAALLSSRFPWVTPAGTFQDPGPPSRTERVVDGGYFENSGVATAIDLVRAMEPIGGEEIEIILIVLTRGEYPKQEFYGLNEIYSPVHALLSTRTSRAYITIADAERELTGSLANIVFQKHVQKIHLLDLSYPTPLGWRLSLITMLLIQAQNGIEGRCGSNPTTSEIVFEANCVVRRVVDALK